MGPWSTAAVSQRERSVWLAAVLEALAPVQYRQMCCITSRTFFSERLALLQRLDNKEGYQWMFNVKGLSHLRYLTATFARPGHMYLCAAYSVVSAVITDCSCTDSL